MAKMHTMGKAKTYKNVRIKVAFNTHLFFSKN